MSGDGLDAVVDGIAAAAALPQYLPVFEPGNDVLAAGPDLAVHPVASSWMIWPVWSPYGVVIDVMPPYPPSPRATRPSTSSTTARAVAGAQVNRCAAGGLLSKQHSAYPRTDQVCLVVADPAENNQPPS